METMDRMNEWAVDTIGGHLNALRALFVLLFSFVPVGVIGIAQGYAIGDGLYLAWGVMLTILGTVISTLFAVVIHNETKDEATRSKMRHPVNSKKRRPSISRVSK